MQRHTPTPDRGDARPEVLSDHLTSGHSSAHRRSALTRDDVSKKRDLADTRGLCNSEANVVAALARSHDRYAQGGTQKPDTRRPVRRDGTCSNSSQTCHLHERRPNGRSLPTRRKYRCAQIGVFVGPCPRRCSRAGSGRSRPQFGGDDRQTRSRSWPRWRPTTTPRRQRTGDPIAAALVALATRTHPRTLAPRPGTRCHQPLATDASSRPRRS
jgi:hypothetical protein